MRTTIELSDEHRAKLLALAGERGTRGFSELVREAIEHFLSDNAARRDRVEAALAALGSLSGKEADELEAAVSRVRGTWR
jgi:predicted transcriptional regulator